MKDRWNEYKKIKVRRVKMMREFGVNYSAHLLKLSASTTMCAVIASRAAGRPGQEEGVVIINNNHNTN
jgi:hypothetical protein